MKNSTKWQSKLLPVPIVLQVFPFGNGSERIYGNRSPGGSVASLNFNVHGANHLARATLEGIKHMRHGLDLMKQMGIRTDMIRAGDASMFRSTIFSQIFCDVTGCPLELVMDTDGALGAARGAALS